ncbi:unnamed protein product [Leptidea sinapis]|uniref:unspecific monooxygenase n=1 Tax=Leptidea sinapis TaxID=189913 RepID=A0A5E4PT61_9NEOP|nr:unnamed protein product [Leptidea sinapis]
MTMNKPTMIHYHLQQKILAVLYYKSLNYWKKRNIVVANGVLSNFLFEKRSLSEIYKDLCEKYSSEIYIGIFLGTRPAVIIKDSRDIQTVMGEFESFHSRGIVTSKNDILADNLLFMDNYCRWKLLRQKLSPVFTSMKLRNMFYIFDRCASDFVDYVGNNNEDFKKNPRKGLYSYTAGSITSSIFGLNDNIKTMESPFMDMANDAVTPNLLTNLQFIIASLFPNIFHKLNLTTFGKEHADFFIGFIKNVFTARKAESGNRHDFIETCLRLKNEGIMRDLSTGYEIEPTDEVLAAQAFFFFIAGIETTATAMQFTFLELAQNPDILIKVHNEIDKVFENCGDKLTHDDVETLNYLDKVISEVLRMHPPIGLLQRLCTKDTILPAGNLTIKKDEIVVVPVFALHKNPKYFPNPELFDPERFDRDNVGNIENCCYIPFGIGNRICIGTRFARLQMKCGLARILRKYTLKYKTFKPHYEPSPFALRDPKAEFELIPRNFKKSIKMLLFLILSVCILLLAVLYYKSLNYWKKRNIVEANGVLSNFLFEKRALAEIYKDLCEKYSSEIYIGIFLGTRPAVIIKDSRDIQTVMGEFESFHSRGIVTSKNDILADNLLFMDNYRRWKLLRQKLSPVFTSMKLRNMFYIFDRCASDFVDYVGHNNEDFKKNPRKGLISYTAGSITSSIFGLNDNIKTMESPFMDMANDVVTPNLLTNLQFIIASLFPNIFRKLNLTTFGGDHADFFIGFIKNVFTARKAESGNRHDFIETCLRLKNEGIMRDLSTGYEIEPTDEILAAQAFFFFVAGIDTTATAMHFTFLELAQNPDILIKVHNEIDKVFENCGDKLTHDDIETLNYLDKVISEVLRMYPPIGLLQRLCTKDTILPAGNLTIKKDEIVVVPIFALHKNPKYFPNPDLFDPERTRFARLQMKCGLARILRKYTLKYKTFKPHYEPSPFALRDPKAEFELIPRNRKIVQENRVLTNFLSGNRALGEVFRDLCDKNSSEIYIGIFFGTNPAVIIKDPRDVQMVLGKIESFHSRGFAISDNDVLGDNLVFINDYRKWKILRQKLSPVFSSIKLNKMFYIFDRCARDLMDCVGNSEDLMNNPRKLLYFYSTCSITSSIFGLSDKSKTMESTIIDMAKKAVAPNLLNNMKFVLGCIFPDIFKMLSLTILGDHTDFFIGFIQNIFKLRTSESGNRNDFIDTCLFLKKQGIMRDISTGYEIEPTDEVLAAQAFFFVVAGIESSSTAMHFTFLELAQNQNILSKVHHEIDKVFGDCDGKITHRDIEKLKYLDKVISEVLRKHPPIGFTQRICNTDTVLPAGNLRIKKERFDLANIGKIENCCYIPFGMGNRICLGARFARLQIKCGLARILRKYTLKYEKFEPHYEPSPFALRDSNAKFQLLPRTL